MADVLVPGTASAPELRAHLLLARVADVHEDDVALLALAVLPTP